MKKKAKLTEAEKLFRTHPVSTLSFTRYTYDSWMKMDPDSDMEEYEMEQCPDNLLDYLTDNLAFMFPNEAPDADLHLTLNPIDDDYFKWLGDREDTAAARSSYPQDPNANSKLCAAHLDVSRFVFGLPLFAIAKENILNTRLNKAAAEGIQEYFSTLVHDPKYSFFAAHYVMDACDLYEKEDIIMQMAATWFNDGVRTNYGMLNTIQVEENELLLGMIPVVVQIKHDLNSLCVRDILCYLNECPSEDKKPSQVDGLIKLLCYDEEKDKPAFISRFNRTTAGHLIAEWQCKNSCDALSMEDALESIDPMLILVDNIPDYCDDIVNQLL